MKKNYMSKKALSILLFAFAFVAMSPLHAQVSVYPFSQTSGTFTPTTGGTVLIAAGGDDESYLSQPIGFTFTYNGTAYTNVSVNANGFIALGTTISSSYGAISTGATNNIIAALNRDLQGQTGSELRIETVGTAPNRTLIVQWLGYRRYAGTGDDYNFQIRLDETTNVVSVVYGTMTSGASTTAQVGLRGASSADFNNRTTTTDWSATTAGVANTATMTLSATVFPASGQTYIWTPPASCTGTPTGGTTASTANPVCPGVTFTLSATGATSASGLTYQWQSSPDGITYTDISGATTSTYNATQTAATYYQLIITCTASGLSATSTPLQVTMNPFYMCYCSTTNAGSSCITNVTLNTLNRSSAACENAPTYHTIVPAATATTTVFQGLTYPFSVSIDASYSAIISVWIDYNQNGVFEASEWQQVATAAPVSTTSTINITIPVSAVTGQTGMRVRSRNSGNINGAGDACTAMGSGETEDYVITIATPPPCSGTPTPGTTVSSSPSVCPSSSFTLSMSTPPTTSGITYQWQSSPDGVTYTDISGATSPTYSTTQTAATYYQVVVTCTLSGLSASSTPVQVTMNSFMSCYCTSNALYTGDEDIFNVTLASLNNSSTCTTTGGPGSIMNEYSDYTATVPATSVAQLTSYPVSVQVGTCGSNYNNATSIYIDFNQNGVFTDPGENVYTSSASSVGPHTESGTINIPGTALTGNTRMRVITVETSTPTSITPCGTYGWGETEDYVLNITPAVPCSGTPSPGATQASPSTVCSGASFTLTMSTPPTGLSGITFQWQSSPDGTTYTNIAGATSSSLTTTQTTATYYQVIVTCTNSGLSATSTPFQVAMNPFMSCYCNSTATTTFDEEITNVTVGALNNNSTCTTLAPGPGSVTNQYSNYMSGAGAPAAPSVIEGAAQGFSVTVGSCGSFNYSSGLAIFVDLNQNGSFADPGEKVYSSGASPSINCVPPTVVTGSFTIPTSALTGTTAMRVIDAEGFSGDAITPCLSYGYGETEDYLLNIAPPPPIDMSPTALYRPTTSGCHTSADSVTITVTNTGSAVMNFATTPVTVSASATGVNPATFTPVVINTGTLAVGASQNVTVSTTYDMSVFGNYTFTATTSVAGDGNIANDTLAPVTINVTGTVATVDNDTICPGTTVNLSGNVPSAVVTLPAGTLINSSTTYPAPYGNWYGGARHEMLVLASELTAAGLTAGNLTGLTFDVVNTNASDPLMNFTISLASTATTSLTGFVADPFTTVYTNPSYAPVTGLNTHSFSTPFYWDGTSNIVVQTCFVNQTGPTTTSYTTNCTFNQVATPFVSTAMYYADGDVTACSAASFSTMSQRPNMTFLRTPASMTYSWSPAAGLSAPTSLNTTAAPTTTTTYTLSATNGTTGCTTVSSVTVYLNPAPVATLNDTTVCAGATYTLDANNAGDTYLWNTGASTQTIAVSSGGLYYVDMTNSFGCVKRDSINLTMNSQPLVNLGPDVAFCAGDSITLDAGNTGFNFLWSTGSVNQTINALTGGSYSVTVTNPSTGCAKSDTIVVTVNPLPVVNLGADTAICAGNSVVLDAGNAGSTYAWSDASTSQTLTVTTTGTYSVTVTNPSTTCVNTDAITVTVNPLPVVALGADTAICSGDMLNLDAGNPGATYLWNDASTAQMLMVMSAGTYSVTVTDANGCVASDAVNISVNPLPVVNIGPDTAQCGGTITLDAGNPGLSFLWNDASTSQTIAASTSGNYYVTVTDGNGCSQTDTAMVSINAIPVVNLGSDMTQCGGSVVLDAGNPGLTYLWNNSTTNQTLTVFVSGTYAVTVTDTVTGCLNSDTTNITILSQPIVNLGSDTVQCGGAITLDAGPGFASYNWYCSMCTGQTLVVNASGTYMVMVGNGTSCYGYDTINVVINPLPSVGMTPFSPICLQAPPYTLVNGLPAGGVYSGTGVSGGMFDPSVAGVGTFPITYTITDSNGCSNSATQNEVVNDCAGVEEYTVFAGLTIYPNPTSGMFSLAVSNANFTELHISITDIQGKEVYQETDKNISNDYVKPLNLEELAKGIYYIRLTAGNELKVAKLIIQ